MVVPQPSGGVPPGAEAPSAPATAPSKSDELFTKYDRRASGGSVVPSMPDGRPTAAVEPVPQEADATEVIVDLRETATGFEAVYERRQIGEDPPDQE
jgi:hypothetical protein